MPGPTKNLAFPANLGLFFDRPPEAVPLRGLQDGNNFRIQNGVAGNLGLGWERFSNIGQLSGPVLLIDNPVLASGAQLLIFATDKDLYRYDEGTGKEEFITPAYTTGTLSATNGSAVVTGSGVDWDAAGVKSGDALFIGSATEQDPAATGNGGWYEVFSVNSPTQVTLTSNYTGTTVSGAAYTLRLRFTGDLDDIWDSEIFFNAQPVDEDTWYATNGVDAIVKWNGSDTFASYTTLGFTCKTLSTYSNMMIYAHIIEDGGESKPTTIKNSDLDKPEELGTGLAGEFMVMDGNEGITALQPLADDLTLYAERQIVMAQFVGDPLGFVFRTAASGIGLVGPRALADFGDFHEFIGQDSQYRFDGVTLLRTGTQVWREVLRTKSPGRVELAFSHFDEQRGDLIWSIPLTTDDVSSNNAAKSAYTEHYLEEVGKGVDIVPVSKRSFPFTCTGYFERKGTLTWDQLTLAWTAYDFRWNDEFFEAAFPFSLAGDADGYIYTINTSSTADGAALASFIRFGAVPISDGRRKNLLTRLYPFAIRFPGASGYTLNIRVFMQDQLSGPATEVNGFTYDLRITDEDHFISVFRRGRYVSVQFGTDGPNHGYELTGYDLDVKPGGFR